MAKQTEKHIEGVIASGTLPLTPERKKGMKIPLTEKELAQHYTPEQVALFLKQRALKKDLEEINRRLNEELGALSDEGEVAA